MKLIACGAAATILFIALTSQGNRFAKYKPVEAYEIRRGVLIMPRYSASGEVCEIGIEKRHYSPEVIFLDSDLSSDEVDAIFDELVPADERGPKSKDFASDLITLSGWGITTTLTYENVSLQIFAKQLSHSSRNEITTETVAATVHWKNRKC